MNKLKYFIIIIFFLCSCRPEFKYEGLKVKFVSYSVETYMFPSEGWGNAFNMKFKVLQGNEYYNKNEIIHERFGNYKVKVWMVQKKLGKVFNVIKNGYALSWMIYF